MKSFIPISQPSITEKEMQYVKDAVQSGWISSIGSYIDRFQDQFAEFCGTKYALSTCNGTTALHLALLSLNIGPGDEVIVPDFSFVATANAVRHAGATPVFADIIEDTLCMDPSKIENLISPRTKAILPVHLYGHPADMPAIMKMARKHKLLVIEDAAEAHGAEIGGKRVGSFGDVAAFSFYGNKIISTGEGGMITTDNEKTFNLARALRDQAMSSEKRYWHDRVAYNYRMTNIQAALGLAQLERAAELIEKKIAIFRRYQERFANHPLIKMNSSSAGLKNVYWMVCVEIKSMSEEKRGRLMERLRSSFGIDSRPYFYPISDMPMYLKANTPVTHRIYSTGLNLPSYHELSDSQIDYICESFLSCLNSIL